MAQELPILPEFRDPESYISSLLSFITSCDLFQMLCGGVHILDFFTREPDIYTTLLPQAWRDWFQLVDVEDVLDLLMRRDLSLAASDAKRAPRDLLDYIAEVRRHCLDREFTVRPRASGSSSTPTTHSLTRSVATGMKPKKQHEVENFGRYVGELASGLAITHLVDFGSGQNYLGRALASPPYNRHVIAIEGREGNIQGAQRIDRKAKLGRKTPDDSHKQGTCCMVPYDTDFRESQEI